MTGRDDRTDARTGGRPRPRRRWRAILAVALVVGIAGVLLGWSPVAALAARLSIQTDDIIAEQRPDPIYEELFPRYVELCATSQWKKQVAGQGNPFGHALMYLKGACKDESAPYPQLRRCERTATSIDDPEHGAGVSVGRFFRNVNWVAVPGYRLFYEGLLDPDETLTQEAFDATVRHAIDAGVFDGVELHAWSRDPAAGLEDYVAAHSAGTDFALRYARNVFCARIPVTEPALDELIAFLNDKNHEYATGEADYNWNLFRDNCVHTVRNALAAANIWDPITVQSVKLLSLLNLAVPANEFVNLAILGADGPLADYRAVQAEGPARDALHDFRWLPTRPGALVKFIPTLASNEVFDPSFNLFAVQSLLRMGKTARTVALLSDPKHVDLETNLRHYDTLYAEIETAHEARRDPLATVQGDPYRRVSRLHLDYIRTERAELGSLLDRLERLKAAEQAAAGEVTPR
jgi:hypothetical protein